jgi:hypothetical protein
MSSRIFAIRHGISYQTLVEFPSKAALDAAPAQFPHLRFTPVTRAEAESWVRHEWEHETGYWIDDNCVLQYAEPEGV